MKILFINHNQIESNSGIHIINIANHLTRLGMECTVCVPNQKRDVNAPKNVLFEVISFDEARLNSNNQKVDIIHAWSPREIVRKMTEELVGIYQCPYIVHLEDNEDYILSASIGKPGAELSHFPLSFLAQIIQPNLSHPIFSKKFLSGAHGISVLMDTLCEFCPTDIPCEIIWAGYEDEIEWAIQPDTKLRQQLGVQLDENLIVYTGNVHSSNRNEVFSLYLAIGLLNRRGIRTRIIRTGEDYVPLLDKNFEVLNDYCINLGYVNRSELPAILSLATVLVQPGRVDLFNNYRFPSKIPEYLATGKLVLLPATNIGRYLQDGIECILLKKGDALEIAQKLEFLFSDSEFCHKIGLAGREFARKNLKWDQSAKKLYDFYLRILANSIGNAEATQPKDVKQPDVQNPVMRSSNYLTENVIQRYSRTIPPMLSYATVKDYCDSADHLSQLMRFDGDLKDVQRPWMVKSILGVCQSGA